MLVYFDPWLAGVVLPGADHRRPDRDPVHRHEPEGQRLLHVQASASAEITIFLFGFVVLWCVADRPRHVPARPELELLRPVRVLGPAQAGGAEQRQPVGDHLGQAAARRAARRSGSSARSFGIVLVLFYVFALPVILAKTLLQAASTRSWARSATTSACPVPDDDVAADQDVPALDLQPEVHRRRSRNSCSTSRRRRHAPQAARRADRSPLQHPAAEPRVLVDRRCPDGGRSSA